MIEAEVGDDLAQVEGFTEMPTGGLAAKICQDLGFTPDWDEWEDKDWARTEAELEMEGSPYCPPPRVIEAADGRYRFSSVKARGTGPP